MEEGLESRNVTLAQQRVEHEFECAYHAGLVLSLTVVSDPASDGECEISLLIRTDLVFVDDVLLLLAVECASEADAADGTLTHDSFDLDLTGFGFIIELLKVLHELIERALLVVRLLMLRVGRFLRHARLLV
jgi:hypothetical protein